jgi:hypothetical protein
MQMAVSVKAIRLWHSEIASNLEHPPKFTPAGSGLLQFRDSRQRSAKEQWLLKNLARKNN